ncbi:MAG TPA: hypothetical protein PK033_15910 [Acetivibrio sp.]|nr:hypothetical protein [Acetivibrio sp.]
MLANGVSALKDLVPGAFFSLPLARTKLTWSSPLVSSPLVFLSKYAKSIYCAALFIAALEMLSVASFVSVP